MAFQSKDAQVLGRQLKVQKMSIPFVVVGSATAANVSFTNDEPSLLFFASASVDQITGALATSETATYTTSASDANGIFQVLLKVNEPVGKIVSCKCFDRVDGSAEKVYLGSATGITTGSGGGNSMMLICDVTVALNAANTVNGCLEVEYSISE